MGLRQTQLSLYPVYYVGDDMFRPLWAIFRSQKFAFSVTNYAVSMSNFVVSYCYEILVTKLLTFRWILISCPC